MCDSVLISTSSTTVTLSFAANSPNSDERSLDSGERSMEFGGVRQFSSELRCEHEFTVRRERKLASKPKEASASALMSLDRLCFLAVASSCDT